MKPQTRMFLTKRMMCNRRVSQRRESVSGRARSHRPGVAAQGDSAGLRSNCIEQEKFVRPGVSIRIVDSPDEGTNKSFPSWAWAFSS